MNIVMHRGSAVGLRWSVVGFGLWMVVGCSDWFDVPWPEPGGGGRPHTGHNHSSHLPAIADAGNSDASSTTATSDSAGASGCWSPALAASELSLFSPLPEVPNDPTNAYADNPGAQALGQRLFFDKTYSGPLAVASDLGAVGDTGKVSCASCHSSALFGDDRSPGPVALGANFHTRNAPAMVNSSFYTWTNWGGRFSGQWELPLPVAESPVILNSSRLAIAHLIYDKYKAEYEAIFGAIPAALSDVERFPLTGRPKPAGDPAPPDGPWELMAASDRDLVNRVFVNYGKALAAYTRKLVSRNAPLDAFIAGDCDAISDAAKRGAELFIGKANCALCHTGPFFSDNGFHNLFVPQTGIDHVPTSDEGRFKDVPGLLTSAFSSAGSFSDDPATGALRLAGLTNPMPDSTKGQFRTPSLRGVALTAPYMHSGQLQTLTDVVQFYNQGGGIAGNGASGTKSPVLTPLGLTDGEVTDLVAFLEALTGEAVDSALRVDTSAP